MENWNACNIDIMLSHVVCLVCLVCLACFLPTPLYNVKMCIYITMYLFGKTGQQNCLAKVGFQNYFSRRGKEQVVNFAKFGSILLKTICQKLCV